MDKPADVVLIGSGIMSATLAVMLKQLQPQLRLRLIEATTNLACEASDGWNNAGTGHAGLCELSYTPSRDRSGQVPIARAVQVFEQFEHSKQFWSRLTQREILGEAQDFIRAVPHVCFLTGSEGVAFLTARHNALREHHFFRQMKLTCDPLEFERWAPLVMEGRAPTPIAATSGAGTEVNYGLLARRMCHWLQNQADCEILSGWKVTKLTPVAAGWQLTLNSSGSNETQRQMASFVFVGAGGGSLALLQSTQLKEFRGLAGFPIAGQWLVCDEPQACARHHAKVYGATPKSAPSLGAGHLDIRYLGGQRQLLFGPFASWTTRFLKQAGSWMDLPRSLRIDNTMPLLQAAVHNRALVNYLIGQGLQSMNHRLKSLREFFPRAQPEQWRLIQAGIRVQTIKPEDGGKIYFGTEIFSNRDKTLAALLGASPGASVAVSIAMEVIRKCLPNLLANSDGQQRMKQLIPTYDLDLKLPQNMEIYQATTRAAEDCLRLGTVD
ncbi:MAG: malate:quinone oxidoreductase [Planctomycetaceae bacterium]|nr:malate:quinone oxidoreductase [Planctomycetaceae bacterium]